MHTGCDVELFAVEVGLVFEALVTEDNVEEERY
jgi:hypothetical protein